MIEEAKAVARRLRKRMPQALVSADMDEAADTIDALVQEVERLREALEDLLDGVPPLWECAERARELLENKHD